MIGDQPTHDGSDDAMTVAVLGEALIDLIVGDDGGYRPHLCGSPFNVAQGIARQGIDVSYLSPFHPSNDDLKGTAEIVAVGHQRNGLQVRF